MSLETIFIPLLGGDLLLPKLCYASALARPLEASVTIGFIHDREDPATIRTDFTGGDVAKGFAAEADFLEQPHLDGVRDELNGWYSIYGNSSGSSHGRVDIKEYWGGADVVLKSVGRLSDVLVTGPCKPRSGLFSDATSKKSLLTTARLTLGLGDVKVEPARLLNHVVIAWDGSPGAIRTLVQAQPILRHALKLSILVIGKLSSHVATAEDLSHYLELRDVHARVVNRPKDLHTTAGAMMNYFNSDGVTLLVMGTYSHNRTEELFLGGTTIDLLEQLTIPVLASY